MREIIEIIHGFIFNFAAGKIAFAGVPDYQGGSDGYPAHSAGDANFFGGGNAPVAPPPKATLVMPPPPRIVIPAAPTPPPPAAIQTTQDRDEAADDARRQAASRNGIQKTVLAGNTGGYQSATTGKTLLG